MAVFEAYDGEKRPQKSTKTRGPNPMKLLDSEVLHFATRPIKFQLSKESPTHPQDHALYEYSRERDY